jgi:hypothetical protein
MKVRIGFIACSFTLLLVALLQGQMQRTYENLDFSSGNIGEMPPGWNLGPLNTPEYAARIVAAPSCNATSRCGELKSVGIGTGRSFLFQNFDAAPYREKLIRFRAAVRTELAAGSHANLLVRVHRTDNSTSFYNDMSDRPITSGTWAFYEIKGLTDKDARDIELGIQLHGQGAAWIDQITLDFYAAK